MAKPTGIAQNSIQIMVSGARVAFDPRTTAEVPNTLDMTNRRISARKAMREAREWLREASRTAA